MMVLLIEPLVTFRVSLRLLVVTLQWLVVSREVLLLNMILFKQINNLRYELGALLHREAVQFTALAYMRLILQ